MVGVQRFTRVVWARRGFWGKTGWLALTPLALVFSLVARVRNLLYDWRILRVESPDIRVISVGNLTVGGTGKTPCVVWLGERLRARGHRVGVLARGYKGTNRGITVVSAGGALRATPAEVGDEAVLLARRFSGIVLAGRDRVAGCRLARRTFGLDVVIVDDGFQHRRLARDVDLLLVRHDNATANCWPLPAGPLREPWTAIRRANAIVVTEKDGVATGLAGAAARDIPLFRGELCPSSLVSSQKGAWSEEPLMFLVDKRVVAVAGIADPLPFYETLQVLGAELADVLTFPDHHPYTRADWQAISRAGRNVDLVVTTEKDLVKLERFPFAIGRLVALRVQLQIEEAAELLARVEHLLAMPRRTDTHES